jgi:Fe-S cluster biogenesis protein NfuA
MDTETVTTAVDDVARILRVDGADLHVVDVDPRTARIRLRLELDDVRCEDCVLDPDALHQTIEWALQRQVPGEFELIVDDPRRDRDQSPR